MQDLLLNLGYALNLFALTVRDVLWLRAVLIPAQLSFLCWGAVSGIRATVIWNLIFLAINFFHITRILRERRPITLPQELLSIYQKRFSVMKPREFWIFWETGRDEDVDDSTIVEENERPSELMFLVSGRAKVVREGATIAMLEAGQFAAEMSFLSGKPASADVVAVGQAKLKVWNQGRLGLLDKVNPELSLKLQKILSQDVTDKVQSGART